MLSGLLVRFLLTDLGWLAPPSRSTPSLRIATATDFEAMNTTSVLTLYLKNSCTSHVVRYGVFGVFRVFRVLIFSARSIASICRWISNPTLSALTWLFSQA